MRKIFKEQKIINKICNFLKKEFKERKKKNAIVGISGGLDSGLVAYLCKKANLNLYAVILPYKNRGLKEAKKVVEFLKLPEKQIFILDITSLIDKQVNTISKIINLDKVNQGNVIARQRMIVLYALAKSLNGLVVGTSNLSEYLLGYFTLHGDGAADIFPMGSLFKTQIYQLAKYLKFPAWLVEKTPSADLWEGQTDEGEFGFSYKEADLILSLFLKGLNEKQIADRIKNKKLTEKVLKRVENTNFKRQGRVLPK